MRAQFIVGFVVQTKTSDLLNFLLDFTDENKYINDIKMASLISLENK